MTSEDRLLLILRRLDKSDRKLDHVLEATDAHAHRLTVCRGNRPRNERPAETAEPVVLPARKAQSEPPPALRPPLWRFGPRLASLIPSDCAAADRATQNATGPTIDA
jgi:hypothetical protein